ncbi:NADP-dependent oxidoreductase [Microlunatus elymi]|uniref:NADP-dependent oxidoreductase n=1 Tax=Microlunatus elymi TaxID=2596828 RepID=A0A516PWV3_9ACTN|nr:NADP-dependent oxidoreductase [Microlunatus elymi]QDP95664.1 NADP-dependent oxidoreductase [Microlunatus elymi]
MPISTREIQLASRPHGEPTQDNFALAEVALPDPQPGEIAVRNLAMSVDPYMRGRMNDAPSYAPPWQLGEAARGGAIGEVTASQSPDVAVGSLVLHDRGWREHAVLPASEAFVVPRRDGLSPTLYLGALGMPGRTAYVGLFRIAAFQPGDTVFVSAAAGAVGSMVGQLAKLSGAARVIGSAGSQDKIDFLLNDLGFDAAFNYHDGPAARLLAQAAPDGIDVYFDNVGGEQLEAAIGAMKLHGRIAVCGQISGYNASSPQPGPRNLGLFVSRRLAMKGFLVFEHDDLADEFTQQVSGWLTEGKIKTRETVVDGLDQAVDAFIGMLRGANTGKMIITL